MSFVPDDVYTKYNDAEYVLRSLFAQIVACRPDDIFSMVEKFFSRLSTSQYIIAQNFNTIRACRSNRRSFVACCREAFAGFPPTTVMSTFDHAILVRALCPNIATALLHEIHFLITPLGKEQTRTYNVRDLNFGLFFVILYDEWVNVIKSGFDTGQSLKYLKFRDVERMVWRVMDEHEAHFDMPSAGASELILTDIKTAFGENSDISYDTFRRSCVSSRYLRDEMYLLLPEGS